jgi:hypothetical protein
MYLTSVLLVINENFNSVDTVKENLKHAGSRVELVVYNNHCQNEKIIAEIKAIASKYINNFTPIEFSFSECINELFRVSSGDYICVFHEYSLLCDNWVKSLIHSHKLIHKSGVISINDWSTNEIAYHLDFTDNLSATYSSNEIVNGLPFFKKELLYSIGGFDPKINGLFCVWDFCKRANINGYYNYFVPDTSLIKENCFIDDYITHKKEFSKIQSSRTSETFIAIFQPTNITSVAIIELKQRLTDSIQYSDKLGAIVFVKDSLNSYDINELNSILSQFNLTIDLFASSVFDETILKNSLVGIIRQ